jgi:ATP synthase protein I
MAEDDERSRLADLDRRLREAETARQPQRAPDRPPGTAVGMAMRVGVELTAGLVVGGMVGWGFDYLLGTKPWLMLVFFLLGAAAGMLNVVRIARAMNESAGAEDRDGPGDAK